MAVVIIRLDDSNGGLNVTMEREDGRLVDTTRDGSMAERIGLYAMSQLATLDSEGPVYITDADGETYQIR
jgi:hypothetical protein